MAAAAPITLTSDSLEVTRSSHLISNRNPTPSTLKALSASSLLLAARAEKKAARIAKGSKQSMAFSGGADLGGAGEEEDDEEMDGDSEEEMDVAEALMGADMGMEVDAGEKIKIKVKSALKKTTGQSMGMM